MLIDLGLSSINDVIDEVLNILELRVNSRFKYPRVSTKIVEGRERLLRPID